MGKRMEITVRFVDDDGETIVEKTGEREVPFVKEIEERGFREAFDDLETSVIELTKETRDTAVAEYLSEASKKKQENTKSQDK